MREGEWKEGGGRGWFRDECGLHLAALQLVIVSLSVGNSMHHDVRGPGIRPFSTRCVYASVILVVVCEVMKARP